MNKDDKSDKRIYRFAPSPTGKMHIGNCRTALLNYFQGVKYNGKFFLRIDDTDGNRDQDDYEYCIYEDLAWLGIQYDQTIKQSERDHIYEEYFQKLIVEGRVYECFEEEDELVENMIYDRRALYLTEEEKVSLRQSRTSYWRFLLKLNSYKINDGIMGKMVLNRNWSDPIIKRARDTKAFTYNFTSAIDDMLMGVTHIIRAQEHFYNSTIQQEIISALSSHIISFSHLPLIINSDGHKLSKRQGALSIETLRSEGYHPLSVISLCLSLGTNQAPLITNNREEYGNQLDLKYFSKNSPKFAKKELTDINRKILKILGEKDMEKLGFDKQIWEIIKNNITYLNEYEIWQDILNKKDLFIPYEEGSMLKTLYRDGILHLNRLTSEKRKNFCIALRLSLTAMEKGPELERILEYKLKFIEIRQQLYGT